MENALLVLPENDLPEVISSKSSQADLGSMMQTKPEKTKHASRPRRVCILRPLKPKLGEAAPQATTGPCIGCDLLGS